MKWEDSYVNKKEPRGVLMVCMQIVLRKKNIALLLVGFDWANEDVLIFTTLTNFLMIPTISNPTWGISVVKLLIISK